jgi:hypothetical protein
MRSIDLKYLLDFGRIESNANELLYPLDAEVLFYEIHQLHLHNSQDRGY